MFVHFKNLLFTFLNSQSKTYQMIMTKDIWLYEVANCFFNSLKYGNAIPPTVRDSELAVAVSNLPRIQKDDQTD